MATARSRAPLTSALLALRLVGGGVLLVHGLQHLLLLGPGPFTDVVAAQGLPAPALLAWLVITGEVVLGVLLVVGLLTRPAAWLATVMLLLIWVTQHLVRALASGTLLTGGGGVAGESALLLAVISLALALVGPGRAALDSRRPGRFGATRAR